MPRRTPKPPGIGTHYAFDPRLDLNLFRVFDAIHTHGGISGAARALHLTQPAISHSLGRLREVFGDPLFVRLGNRMVPTDRTRAVIGDIRAHLQALFAAVQASGEFDPALLDMEFRVALRDVLESTAIPVLMQHLDREAPRLRLACRQVAREHYERELAAGSLDFVIDRRFTASPALRRVHLADEEVAVIAARGRFPKGKTVLTPDDYLAARHAVVTHLEGRDPVDSILAETGLSRRIALRAAHYFSACQVVAGSDMLLTMPRTYASQMAGLLPIRVFALPVPISPIQVFLYWHRSRDDDRRHTWMRDTVIGLARTHGWLLDHSPNA